MAEVITWRELNEHLRKISREADAKKFYEHLKTNRGANPRWVRRAFGRYTELRRRREKKELGGKL